MNTSKQQHGCAKMLQTKKFIKDCEAFEQQKTLCAILRMKSEAGSERRIKGIDLIFKTNKLRTSAQYSDIIAAL